MDKAPTVEGNIETALPITQGPDIELSNKLTEYFRQICVALQPREGATRPQVIGFTSSVRGEGVTTIAFGVAKCLALEMLGRVLFIECDQRQPTIHEFLGIPQEPGLSGFLGGPVEIDKVIRTTQIQGLAVVPAGKTSGTSTLMMRPQRFATFLDTLRAEVDYIVLDMPPIISDPISVSLIDHTDAVFFITRAGAVPTEIVREALERVNKSRLKGTILNGRQRVLPRWLERLF